MSHCGHRQTLRSVVPGSGHGLPETRDKKRPARAVCFACANPTHFDREPSQSHSCFRAAVRVLSRQFGPLRNGEGA